MHTRQKEKEKKSKWACIFISLKIHFYCIIHGFNSLEIHEHTK